MKVVKDSDGLICVSCPHDALQKAIDENKALPKTKRKNAKEIKDFLRVVATCDKPRVNIATEYKVCGNGMCRSHAREPQQGLYWCAACATKENQWVPITSSSSCP